MYSSERFVCLTLSVHPYQAHSEVTLIHDHVFFPNRGAIDAAFASNVASKYEKTTDTSKSLVAEVLIGPVDEGAVDVASVLCDRTSDGGCSSQPVLYQSAYGSFSQIFTAYHRAPSKQAGMAKKRIEQHNADEVAALYHNVCLHLKKYTSGKTHATYLLCFRFPPPPFSDGVF